jgi:tRNA A37 threonylcarbamoyladenosine modification protein TsaB
LFVNGGLKFAEKAFAPMQAGSAVFEMLKSAREEVDVFAADLGPGSFTGTKVGVVIAKTLAYARRAKVAGFSSFDLISSRTVAAVPSRKGMYLVRIPGEKPVEVEEEAVVADAVGYGPRFQEETFPLAECAGSLLDKAELMEPEYLLPNYVLEPSISSPKKPFGTGAK